MIKPSHGPRAVPNSGGAATCTAMARSCTVSAEINAVLRAVFHRKTWAELIAITGVSERMAKHRMSQSRPYTADEIAALLRSEHGLNFLVAVMGDADPQWWRTVKRAFAIGTARREKQRLQDAINELERMDETIIRAETALAVSDADFHRVQIDALRAARGADGRAVAGMKIR